MVTITSVLLVDLEMRLVEVRAFLDNVFSRAASQALGWAACMGPGGVQPLLQRSGGLGRAAKCVPVKSRHNCGVTPVLSTSVLRAWKVADAGPGHANHRMQFRLQRK